MHTYLTQLPFLNYLIFSIIIWVTMLILKKNIKNKIILLIEIFYILTAVIILFYPENILISNGINTSYFQILPFKTIKEYITNKSYFSLICNIFILFPIPIFLFIHKITLKKNMAISFLIAVAIEPIQLLINIITKYPNKIIDIDDFILYIIGVLISLIILFISKKIIK